MSRAIPLLPYVKNDGHRLVWARAFYAFCETLREYATSYPLSKSKSTLDDTAEEPNTEGPVAEFEYEIVTVDDELIKTYADQLETAYEAICSWPSSREQKVIRCFVYFFLFTRSSDRLFLELPFFFKFYLLIDF